MRIIQLTAGTGGFHCGTCIRDNALVVELRRQGHDALLVPMYLPPTLDEASAIDNSPLFFGGVNVYLQQKAALFRKTPRWLDQLLDSESLLRYAASKSSMTTAQELAELTISMLDGEEGHQIKELDRLVDWLKTTGQPQVVLLSTSLLIGLARRIKETTGAKIGCFLNGEDTYLDTFPDGLRQRAWNTMGERARDVDFLLPVSRYYGDLMAQRAGFPAERVYPLYPGILLDGYGPSQADPANPVLGFFARMRHSKGLSTLIEAYILLRARNKIPNLRLRVAGSQTAEDRAYVATLCERLAAKGLANDVEFLPNLDRDEKIRFLRGLSALSVPATYGESFGLYVIEALAAGTPVVQPRHAAFPEIIRETGGGVLCEPDDPLSLATAVEDLLTDPAAARAMGERGRQVVHQRFGVEQMARSVMDLFEERAVPSEKAGCLTSSG